MCLTQREIKVSQNAKFSQNRENKVLRNVGTSKSRNKRVEKISCNKETSEGRLLTSIFKVIA